MIQRLSQPGILIGEPVVVIGELCNLVMQYLFVVLHFGVDVAHEEAKLGDRGNVCILNHRHNVLFGQCADEVELELELGAQRLMRRGAFFLAD